MSSPHAEAQARHQRSERPRPLADAAAPSTGRPQRLLVLRALGLGDFLTAVPALRALERAHPGWSLHLAAPSAHGDLLTSAGLDWRLLPTTGPATPPWPYPDPPDTAVNLHGSGPESVRALRAPAPGRLVTHAGPGAPGVPGPPWPGPIHDVDIWCRLLAAHGISADPGDVRLPRTGGPVDASGAAVVHPGAAFPARRWPADRFAAVARHLADRGLDVAITGSAAERPLARDVADRAGLHERHVHAGRTPLPELAALVADAPLVVCGDTGTAHLATAYSTPSVVLFGPVDPALWGPRIDTARHTCLWHGRRGDPHGREPDPGLLRIGVDEVVAAAERMLAHNRPFSGPGTNRPPQPRRPGRPGRTGAAGAFRRESRLVAE
ncbi:glycosyltransferase family 9 protein [Streptomonospora litoralis]|uniref:ADP-heptose--LPS heptosyltransferase 2 n=1 Tax=Streptomonospora litoralis TaxID=2498135 RepID=A0A4P6Q1Q1_9ACTN|nr:glycosyltransferase family 9 protein [Streptomonospora litoralis]QBI54518.1 ADP-heptose--LPS heptosyltransferase 2 [Streptomonospora litoralis]